MAITIKETVLILDHEKNITMVTAIGVSIYHCFDL